MIIVDKSQKDQYLKKIAAITKLHTGDIDRLCMEKARLLIDQLEAAGLIQFKNLD